jgi:hypothetical protein
MGFAFRVPLLPAWPPPPPPCGQGPRPDANDVSDDELSWCRRLGELVEWARRPEPFVAAVMVFALNPGIRDTPEVGVTAAAGDGTVVDVSPVAGDVADRVALDCDSAESSRVAVDRTELFALAMDFAFAVRNSGEPAGFLAVMNNDAHSGAMGNDLTGNSGVGGGGVRRWWFAARCDGDVLPPTPPLGDAAVDAGDITCRIPPSADISMLKMASCTVSTARAACFFCRSRSVKSRASSVSVKVLLPSTNIDMPSIRTKMFVLFTWMNFASPCCPPKFGDRLPPPPPLLLFPRAVDVDNAPSARRDPPATRHCAFTGFPKSAVVSSDERSANEFRLEMLAQRKLGSVVTIGDTVLSSMSIKNLLSSCSFFCCTCTSGTWDLSCGKSNAGPVRRRGRLARMIAIKRVFPIAGLLEEI